MSGFKFGFPIHYSGASISCDARNLLSQNPDAVEVKIRKELEAGRLAGPFPIPPLSPFGISQLGVVPKKNPGEFLLIHHLSYPKGCLLMMVYHPSTPAFHVLPSQTRLSRLSWLVQGVFYPKQILKMPSRSYLFGLRIIIWV